jgi:hypothetical protein
MKKGFMTLIVFVAALTCASVALSQGAGESGKPCMMSGEKGKGASGMDMPMTMDKEAMQGHRQACMDFQATLKDVLAQIEKAKAEPNEAAKTEKLLSSLEQLVKGMQTMRATCPMMHMSRGGMHSMPMDEKNQAE